MKLDIRDFGNFENAFTEFVTSHLLRIMEGNKIAQHYDRDTVNNRLTAYIEGALGFIRDKLHGHISELDPVFKIAQHDIAVNMPALNAFGDNGHGPIGSMYDGTMDALKAFSVNLRQELQRVMRFTMSFRFVRRSNLHTFELVSVNGLLEEITPASIIDSAPWLPDGIDAPQDAEDETLPRPDPDTEWVKNYTLVGSEFELGRTLIFTEEDVYRGLETDVGFGDMIRTLLGLGDTDIDDLDISGALKVRIYENKSKVVELV